MGVFLLLYVDDMLIASTNKQEIERLKHQLKTKFEIKDLGEAKKILGMQIFRNKKKKRMFISQGNYIKKVLERFSMIDAKSATTPLAQHFKLSSS